LKGKFSIAFFHVLRYLAKNDPFYLNPYPHEGLMLELSICFESNGKETPS